MKIHKIVVGSLGTNCYVVVSDKNNGFIIDPGDDISDIRNFLSENKIAAKFIVNTHGHIDHIRANADLKLPVYVHKKDSDMISDPEKNITASFLGGFEPVVPDKLLEDADALELDELKFKVIHTPGHTKGGLCLSGGGVLFSGDTLFKNGIGRTDLPDASYEEIMESLKKLARLPGETVVYPGHGPQTTIGNELF